MANTKYLQNNFSGGLNLDAAPWNVPNTDWTYALNAVNKSAEHIGGFLTNEESTKKCVDLPGRVRGAKYIDERDQSLLFINKDEIWLVDHKECTTKFVMSGSEFGCDWNFNKCEMLYPIFKPMGPCNELHIYFSSCCCYYVVNIDEMCDGKRRVCKECEDFHLFKCVCGPNITAIVSDSGGYSLEAGAYQFVAQLVDEDNNATNWFPLTTAVHVGSENNIPGERSTASIKLNIDCLDSKYSNVNIAVVKTIGGQVREPELVVSKPYNDKGITHIYHGHSLETLTFEEIFTKRRTYIKGQDLFQNQNRLFLYNTKQENNLDYQRRANKIKGIGVIYEVKAEEAHKFKTLMRGERYLPAIVWNYCDGTHTVPFPLSCDGAGAPECGGGGGASIDGTIANVDYKAEECIRQEGIDDPEEHEEDMCEVLLNRILGWTCDTDQYQQTIDEVYEHYNATPNMCSDAERLDEMGQTWMDYMAGFAWDECQPVGSGDDLLDSLKHFINRFLTNRETVRGKAAELNMNESPCATQQGSEIGLAGGAATGTNQSGNSVRGDEYTDASGKSVLENLLTTVKSVNLDCFLSSVNYPETKNCEGEHIYGELAGAPIRLFQMPCESEEPITRTTQQGVISKHTPDADPHGDTFVRLLGMKFTGIEWPNEDELPKPLCKTNPYRIVMAKRDDWNRRIVAKGAFFGTFDGEARGKCFAVPRHGVNSYHNVDRHVDNGGSRISASNAATPRYTFHSPDTDFARPGINASTIKISGEIYGTGWKHGQYAEGKKPEVSQIEGTRLDNRGTRQSVNLNHFRPIGSCFDLNGAVYADANHKVNPKANIDMPLMNLYREKSVYLQSSGVFPGLANSAATGHSDRSFAGDVLDHVCPLTGAAHYGSLIRDIPDQYGSVEHMSYVDTGLTGNKNSGSEIEGPFGDTYINLYSKRRTGYVSEKVGNEFNIPALYSNKRKTRTICDSPEAYIFQITGHDYYPTKLPKTGDGADAKNWAGLHTIDASFTRPCNTRQVGDVTVVSPTDAGLTDPESDYFYPRVQKTLVHFWAESSVNVHYRQTSPGLGIATGNVHYDNLKEMYLDAAAPSDHPWEESWLTRFFCEQEQPSRRQIWLKNMILLFLVYGLPTLAVKYFLNVGTLLQGGMVAFPFMAAMWAVLVKDLLSSERINDILGIPNCFTDEQGGNEECIRNFEDNHYEYSHDYGINNDISTYQGAGKDYYTCICNDCENGHNDETTNIIYYSNPQIIGSNLDAYKNFHANDIATLPADGGPLQDMFVHDGRMYAHTTDNIYQLSLNSSEAQGLGAPGGLLSTGLSIQPYALAPELCEGFAGTLDPNATIQTPRGVIFIDREGKEIYLWNSGSGLEKLSKKGLNRFWRDYMEFCSEGECEDERNGGNSYVMGWDYNYDRLLITKRDTKHPFTLSYDFERNRWISFHSYTPEFYIWNRDSLYSIDKGALWKHGFDCCNYQTFYDTYYPFIVEYVVNNPSPYELNYVSLHTDAYKCNGCDYNRDNFDSFTEAAFWNAYQSTGTLTLDKRKLKRGGPYDNNTAKDRGQTVDYTFYDREWRLNRLNDNTIDCEKSLLTCDECSPFREINDDNACADPNSLNNILYDRYTYSRFTYMNDPEINLYFNSALTNVETYER